jgi:hypothetical protein
MIELKLTKQEAQAIASIMDAGVKSIGLNCVMEAATIVSKLNAAMTEERDGENG